MQLRKRRVVPERTPNSKGMKCYFLKGEGGSQERRKSKLSGFNTHARAKPPSGGATWRNLPSTRRTAAAQCTSQSRRRPRRSSAPALKQSATRATVSHTSQCSRVSSDPLLVCALVCTANFPHAQRILT
eukprot:4677033-Pleurochrysis_carterae.AAC.2